LKYIYADNYRGFRDTLIPIENVNFFVGENSTGKTSILGLLKLLSSQELWFQSEFDPKSIGMGTFADIVSANSSDKSSFTIGTAFYGKVNRSEQKPRQKKRGSSKKKEYVNEFISVVMTFVEDNGVPKLSSLVSIRNSCEVRLKYSKSAIRQKVTTDDYKHSSFDGLLKKLKSLKNLAKSDRRGYKVIERSGAFLLNAPPLIVVSIVEHEVGKGSSKDSGLDNIEMQSLFGDMAWIAPIRSKPRKTYDEFSLEFSPEGDHTPYVIKQKLDSKAESPNFTKFIEKLGKKSGLFKSLEIKKYGRGATSPFQLDVVLNDTALSINSVGYGVSQALPVVVEIYARRNGSWFAIQQPEVHLHPKAQAALGEVIYELASLEGKSFIIETHSDYLIDRFRVSARKSKKSVATQILYFERAAGGNKVHSIAVDKNGIISSDQPSGYRDFFLKEEMTLLGL
jgi:predicted ATPase